MVGQSYAECCAVWCDRPGACLNRRHPSAASQADDDLGVGGVPGTCRAAGRR